MTTLNEIICRSKLATKMIVLARSGRLECRKNVKGTLPEKYRTSESTDDENHRINECSTWKETNYLNKEQKPSLDDIFSREFNVLNNAFKVIQNVWEVKYANGRMRKLII